MSLGYNNEKVHRFCTCIDGYDLLVILQSRQLDVMMQAIWLEKICYHQSAQHVVVFDAFTHRCHSVTDEAEHRVLPMEAYAVGQIQ